MLTSIKCRRTRTSTYKAIASITPLTPSELTLRPLIILYVTHLIKMSHMSTNYIFGKTAKYDETSFLLIFIFDWKWTQKHVFSISDISHLMKLIDLVFIREIFETC